MSDENIFDPHRLSRVLRDVFALPPGASVYVAYSGGPDSTALLHAVHATRRYRVIAAHAHHGHGAADQWRDHCLQQCAAWGVECVSTSLRLDQGDTTSWEARARSARYAWLASLLQPGDHLATAHHLQDQAETVLAHLLRGAGVTGLSGMPVQRPLGRGTLIRPLLGFSPESLRDYLRSQRLTWIDDPSNLDLRHSRNRIRHQVLPALQAHWPAARAVLAATAARMREIDALLLDVGGGDLADLGQAGEAVSVIGLRRLNRARQANALRTWIRRRGLPMPPHKRLHEVLTQLVDGDPAPTAEVAWGNSAVRRYRDGLYLVPLLPDISAQSYEWDLTAPLVLRPLAVKLEARPVTGAGLARNRIVTPITVRWRRGGERVRLPGRTHHHQLKKLLQDAGVPPWQRDRIPLLFCGDELAAAVGYWYFAPFAAQNAESGYEVVLSAV